MKIVIDARESGTSTGRYIDQLVVHLHKLKLVHEIIVLTKQDRLDYFAKNAPNFKTLRSDYQEFTFAEQLGFAWQLYKLHASLVHFNAPQQPILYLRRSVTTIHDLTTLRFNNPAKFWPIYKFKQVVYGAVVRWVAHKSKALIAISKYTRGDLLKFTRVKPTKVEVIYEAGDEITDAPKPISGLKNKPFIIYAGRPLPHKNLRRLIDAFGVLQQSHPALRLVLVGKTDKLYAQHERYVKNRGIKNVLFTGFVSEGELRWLYENCQAYTMPSLSEGFGLPALEAMSAGAPVASSNASCLPEIYGKAAHYFDPLDINDMATKIGEVLENQKLRAELVKAGNQQVKKYSWQHMAEQTLAVYQKVLVA